MVTMLIFYIFPSTAVLTLQKAKLELLPLPAKSAWAK
jgi:hypothetical protein